MQACVMLIGNTRAENFQGSKIWFPASFMFSLRHDLDFASGMLPFTGCYCLVLLSLLRLNFVLLDECVDENPLKRAITR